MSDINALAVSKGISDGVLRIVVTGEIDAIAEKEFVAHVLDAIQATDAERIVLDLDGVTFIDSWGLRLLLKGRRQADTRRVLLTLMISPDSPVARLLEVAGVREMFAYELAD